MCRTQFPDRRMPDHRIFQRMHRQLSETRLFHVTRHDTDRRRAVRTPSLRKAIHPLTHPDEISGAVRLTNLKFDGLGSSLPDTCLTLIMTFVVKFSRLLELSDHSTCSSIVDLHQGRKEGRDSLFVMEVVKPAKIIHRMQVQYGNSCLSQDRQCSCHVEQSATLQRLRGKTSNLLHRNVA
ncbi:hypothetical protein TNCV_2719911 [Trichonephila clavipes]|nr:hypothetical protein TNCV_2719911 [Trichonephila clavipes]